MQQPISKSKLSLLLSIFLLLCMSIGSTVSAAPQCNETDKDGWTNQLPTAYDPSVALESVNQRGSRIIYISRSKGRDETGEFYFWDGSQLVDSKGSPRDSNGRQYGTNPLLPSDAVRSFKHWAAVAPRSDGGDLLSRNPTFGTAPITRAGYPDWWLFARNETFDLSADFRAVVPNATLNPNFVASLATSGGRSLTEPQVVTAYGSFCLPRPRFVSAILDFVTRFESTYAPPFRNVLYSSLHFDGRGMRDGTGALRLLGQTKVSTNLRFEDMWFDAAPINIGQKNNGEITIRRSLLTDAHSSSGKARVQGIYYEGGPDGVVRIEESILMRNGFRGDPKSFAWPPKGDQTWNIFNRNIYMTGMSQSPRSGFFDSVSMMGTSGDQFRQGLRIERSFFYQGYLMIGGAGGGAEDEDSSGVILNSVLQRFEGTGTNDNRGQPGLGIEVGWAANKVQVVENIVTGAQHPAKSYAIKFTPYNLCPYSTATQNNVVRNNILDSGSAISAVSTVDGVQYPQGCDRPWQFPGVLDNQVYRNILINTTANAHSYIPIDEALGTVSSTVVRSNRLLIDRNQGMAVFNWSDPNRTLRTYLLSKGVTVQSVDGFPEYFDLATKMQRGRWDENWVGRSLINYIRAGFNKPMIN